MSDSWKKIQLDVKGDERGSLVALESLRDVPFEFKRLYYIFENQKGLTRGKHAHQNLKQLMICVSGRCKVRVDNGERKSEITLDNPSEGLYIFDVTWREITDMAPGSVVIVLADQYYDEEDYIRSYEEFVELVKKP